MGHVELPSSLCSDVVVKGCHLNMHLAQSPGLRLQRHNKETKLFVDFGQHKADNLYLRRVSRHEAEMAAQDGSCRRHKGQERDVEEEHRRVSDLFGTETGYNIRWRPC